MRHALLLAGWLLLLAPLQAREIPPTPPPVHDEAFSLYVHQRILRKNTDWHEAFKPLPGFDLEAQLMESNILEDLSIGIYASLGLDNFSGKTESYRTNTVEVDDMSIWTLLAGFRTHYDWGSGFFSTGSVGLGLAHYPSVDETVTYTSVSDDFEMVDQCNRFAAEAGLRIGYRFSPVAVLAGVKYRFLDNPELGDAATVDDTPLDTLTTLLFEVGAQIEF